MIYKAENEQENIIIQGFVNGVNLDVPGLRLKFLAYNAINLFRHKIKITKFEHLLKRSKNSTYACSVRFAAEVVQLQCRGSLLLAVTELGKAEYQACQLTLLSVYTKNLSV